MQLRKKKLRKKGCELVESTVPAAVKAQNPLTDLLTQSVQTGDFDLFRTSLASEIDKTNKRQLAKKTGVGRRTLYSILDPAIDFNPNLTTISALIRGLAG